MALTRRFKELVQRRAAEEPAFGEALLREGIDAMLTGDIDTGEATLRNYIKTTVGFEKPNEATDTFAKSPIRMSGPRGNPQVRNLFWIIGTCKIRRASSCMSHQRRDDSSGTRRSP